MRLTKHARWRARTRVPAGVDLEGEFARARKPTAKERRALSKANHAGRRQRYWIAPSGLVFVVCPERGNLVITILRRADLRL